VPFGLRFIHPLRHDRVELSVGAGGLYEHFSGFDSPSGLVPSYGAFGGFVKASVEVALDNRRRFWVGATPRVIVANGTNARDRWFMVTGDVGFRF